MYATVLALASAVSGGVTDACGPQFYVIDFEPVGGLRPGTFRHRLFLTGESAEKKLIKLYVPFTPDKTPGEVRDLAFDVFERARLPVQKVGTTKVLVGPCKFLGLTTEKPPGNAFPVNCQPTLTAFSSEKDALKEK